MLHTPESVIDVGTKRETELGSDIHSQPGVFYFLGPQIIVYLVSVARLLKEVHEGLPFPSTTSTIRIVGYAESSSMVSYWSVPRANRLNTVRNEARKDP